MSRSNFVVHCGKSEVHLSSTSSALELVAFVFCTFCLFVFSSPTADDEYLFGADHCVFLLSIPLKYREKWMIIGPTQNCDIETLSLGTFKKDLVKEVMLKRSKLVPHLPKGNLEIVLQEY